MDTGSASSPGLLGSLRGFADNLLGSAHDRLELLAVELQEEKQRLIQVFIWISAIVFLAMLALVFASMAIVVLLWDTHRIAVVCSLAAIYLIALLGVVLGFRNYLRRQPKPFAATLGELRADRECIRAET